MYAREVDQQKLTFVVSGKLWNRSLVMQDLETESLWSHLLGKGMDGKLKGTELVLLPSTMMEWKTWKAANPKGTVLAMSRTAEAFVRDALDKPRKFVLGVRRIGGEAIAFPYEKLRAEKVVNGKLGEQGIVVRFESVSAAAYVFDRGELEFEPAAEMKMRDTKTKSLWDGVSGECVDGELKGETLPVLVGVPSYRKAWFTFFPDSEESR